MAMEQRVWTNQGATPREEKFVEVKSAGWGTLERKGLSFSSSIFPGESFGV
jgi:hypothetical protein